MRSCLFAASVALALVAGCHDGGTVPLRPASIEIVDGGGQSGTVGQRVATTPTFVVKDESGRALSGVSVAVAVTAGNGSVADTPRKTSGNATSVGTWTLGQKTGINQLTVTVAGLPPIVFEATARVGAVARIAPVSTTTFNGRVAEVVSPAPMARIVDAFGNPIDGTRVEARVLGGGTASSTFTSDADGNVTVAGWILGTKVGQDVLTLTSGSATLSFIANKVASDPASIVAISGDLQSALAGAPLASPILLSVADRFGNSVLGQTASFTVTGGGGEVAAITATADATGTITVPSWRLGRTALPQVVHVAVADAALDLTTSVQTDFHIDIRFFGPSMTEAQEALFTNAAARLSAIIIGDLPDVTLRDFDVAQACGLPGLPTLNETVDDVVIYASVQDIDGAGRILAEAGPCGFRNFGSGHLTSVGVMAFDAADIERIGANGTLQDVITHEMLHVLGIGTLWSVRNLLQSPGTPNVTYLGRGGAGGCFDSGGAPVCGAGVPVENNGVPGTADAHWRESTFQSELMTGYVNLGGMPLSSITVGSLQDMGYTVNMLAADPFHVPLAGASTTIIPGEGGWERRPPSDGVLISPTGVVTPIKRP
jgi:hypothetical protein